MKKIIQSLLTVFVVACISPSVYGNETMTFSADPQIQTIAEAYAQDAVDFSKSKFGITLDWSDESITEVERALELMHSSFMNTSPRPTEEQAMSFAKGYGSYIGEVYRRNHGAEWGLVDMDGQKFPGLKTESGVNFWPWGRALNRIMEGSENNISHYYNSLLAK